LSSRGLCDELITRPEESYRLCCVVVCDLETSRMGAPYIYDISRLRVNTTKMKSSGTPSTSKIIVIWDVANDRSSLIYRVKMKALRPSETYGTTQRTTQYHIPQDLSNTATSRPKRYTIPTTRLHGVKEMATQFV